MHLHHGSQDLLAPRPSVHPSMLSKDIPLLSRCSRAGPQGEVLQGSRVARAGAQGEVLKGSRVARAGAQGEVLEGSRVGTQGAQGSRPQRQVLKGRCSRAPLSRHSRTSAGFLGSSTALRQMCFPGAPAEAKVPT
eukprot:1154197-Pelagomonas_calceolata.AAC.2